MELAHKVMKLYTYLRFGIANYLNMFIALFNTANLIWGFTPLRHMIGLFEFIALFLLVYTPVVAVVGYYDLKRGVSKVTQEVNPFWRRAMFFERKIFIGSVIPFPPLEGIGSSEKIEKCWKEAYEDGLRWISDENHVPKSACFCDALFEEGLLDEEGHKKCVEVALSEE